MDPADNVLHIDHGNKAAGRDSITPPKPAADVETQTIVQVNIYRMHYDTPEFLLLKRIDDDDRSWQPVSHHVVTGDDIADAVKQALKLQAGLDGFKKLSSEMYTYEWYAHGQQGRDVVFAAEVAMETPIAIDSSRFSQSVWLPYSQAIEKLKWQGNKEALRRLRDHIIAERLAHPPPPSQTRQQQPTANEPQPAIQQVAPPEPYVPPQIPVNVIPLPVYDGPDALPPPPPESIPGNQQAPDIPLPPQPETPHYPFSPRQ